MYFFQFSMALILIVRAKNGISIITDGTRKMTVCSSTFYGVNSNFTVSVAKIIFKLLFTP